MAPLEYTEKQLKIINGETSMETADGRTLGWLYKKAVANNDHELAEKVKARLDALKAIYDENNRRRALSNYHLKRKGGFKWKQPKSNEYTEHQKQVIRGDIPIQEVHTKELISIHLKAYNNGDYELYERFLDLIYSRERTAKDRCVQHKRATKKYKEFAAFIDYDADSELTKWEQAVLMCRVDTNEWSEEQLQRILDIAQKQNNEEWVAIANQMLLYKTEPSVLFAVKNHKEAIELLEEMFGKPIRKPDSWFNE